MMLSSAMGQSLEGLATIWPEVQSHRSSSFDGSGGNGDCIGEFRPGDRKIILDTAGPGQIDHIWMTVSAFPGHDTFLRDLIVRMYWDGSNVPSVEVPVGDFFGLGHARTYAYQSAPVAVGESDRAMNCYWPMPFHKSARVELYNNGTRTIRSMYYHIDYETGTETGQKGLFHAAYHRERNLHGQDVVVPNLLGKDNYVILDTEGAGQYVGCFLFVDSNRGGWWGEGDDMIFIDHSEKPTINGTGSEDYFNNAWGFHKAFSYPFYGCPLLEPRGDGGMLTTVYRWHIPDPIRFQKHIRVTLEHDWPPKIANDFTSIAFWYQRDPVKSREPIPRGRENWPNRYPSTLPAPTMIEVNGAELKDTALDPATSALAKIDGNGDDRPSRRWLRVLAGHQPAGFSVNVPAEGNYSVSVQPVDGVFEGTVRMGLAVDKMRLIEPVGGRVTRRAFVGLGIGKSVDGKIILYVSGKVVGIHTIKLELNRD
jgi:hypothetical protein